MPKKSEIGPYQALMSIEKAGRLPGFKPEHTWRVQAVAPYRYPHEGGRREEAEGRYNGFMNNSIRACATAATDS